MATVSLSYSTPIFNGYLAQGGCCSEVALCLPTEWAGLTVSGLPLIKATVINVARRLGNTYKVPFENPRCLDLYQYTLEYDDTQITDPVTNIVDCADILDVFSGCLADLLLGIGV